MWGLRNSSITFQEAGDRARIESKPTFAYFWVVSKELGLTAKAINNLTVSWIGTISKSRLQNHSRNSEIGLIFRLTIVTAKVK